MIITCEKCSKKFNIDDNLIPVGGRQLQCGSCNYKWFFKKNEYEAKLENEVSEKIPENDTISNNENNYQEINKTTQKQNDSQNKDIIHKNIQKKIKKNPKIIKNSIVIIISIIATILLIDTFKFQLNNYIPGIDSILNNLYESLKDLSLFFKDLIN